LEKSAGIFQDLGARKTRNCITTNQTPQNHNHTNQTTPQPKKPKKKTKNKNQNTKPTPTTKKTWEKSWDS